MINKHTLSLTHPPTHNLTPTVTLTSLSHSHTHLSLSRARTHARSLTHSLAHSLRARSLTHSLTHSRSHSHLRSHSRTRSLTHTESADLSVVFVVGEVHHHQQLQICLHLRDERRGRSFCSARPEQHVSFSLHRLKQKHTSYS